MRSRQSRESRIEAQSEDFLNHLRGYQRRQEWGKTDRAFVVAVLTEWENQVIDLDYRIQSLELRVKEAESLNRHYERKLIGKGFGSYIKFLLGISECPSQ